MPLQEAITGSTGSGGTPLGVSSIYLEALTLANITPPTVPTTLVWNTVVSDSTSVYNPISGVITIPATGDYVFTLQLHASAANAGTKSLYGFVEYSINAGTTWLPLDYSGRVTLVSTTTPETKTYTINRFLVQGVQVRLRYYASGADTRLTSVTLPSTTVVVPSSRLTMTA